MPQMKKYFLILFLVFYASTHAQSWTSAQLAQANTAANVAYLSNVEKECIMYINLCRLYPKDFLRNELLNYYGTYESDYYLKDSEYRQSLIDFLSSSASMNALSFNDVLYRNALCFAKEQGASGETGHDRRHCEEGNYAECCSYGLSKGKDIALQLLIDHDVPSLGHRKICLNSSYTKIGVSVQPHIEWETCAIFEFIW
jgi:hypothetical protein